MTPTEALAAMREQGQGVINDAHVPEKGKRESKPGGESTGPSTQAGSGAQVGSHRHRCRPTIRAKRRRNGSDAQASRSPTVFENMSSTAIRRAAATATAPSVPTRLSSPRTGTTTIVNAIAQ